MPFGSCSTPFFHSHAGKAVNTNDQSSKWKGPAMTVWWLMNRFWQEILCASRIINPISVCSGINVPVIKAHATQQCQLSACGPCHWCSHRTSPESHYSPRWPRSMPCAISVITDRFFCVGSFLDHPAMMKSYNTSMSFQPRFLQVIWQVHWTRVNSELIRSYGSDGKMASRAL